MVRMNDFQDANGHIDFSAYHRAQVEAGDKCWSCGALINLLHTPGHRDRCNACKEFDSDMGEVDHSTKIRCPHCGGISDASQHEWSIEREENTVNCWHCDKDFVVKVTVTYTFTSPARGKTGSEDEKDE